MRRKTTFAYLAVPIKLKPKLATTSFAFTACKPNMHSNFAPNHTKLETQIKYSQLVSEEIYKMFSQPKHKISILAPSFVTGDLLNNCRNKLQHAFQMGNSFL